jgi:hypothetical protein
MWTRATYKLNHYQFLLKKIVPLQPCSRMEGLYIQRKRIHVNTMYRMDFLFLFTSNGIRISLKCAL